MALFAPPVTLVQARAPITAFAQDGPRIAWAEGGTLSTRLLPGGKTVVIHRDAGLDATLAPPIAVAGDRVAWVDAYPGNVSSDTLRAWQPGHGSTTIATASLDWGDVSGSSLSIAGGDDGLLVYGRRRYDLGHFAGVTFSSLHRKIGEGRSAFVAAPYVGVARESVLELRRGSALATTLSLQDVVALGPTFAVVRPTLRALRVYAIPSGRLLYRLAIAYDASRFSAGRRGFVFTNGFDVWFADGEIHRVARAAGAIGVLSIEGRRIAWTEGRRIRAVVLP